jgi:hypothetical protein
MFCARSVELKNRVKKLTKSRYCLMWRNILNSQNT